MCLLVCLVLFAFFLLAKIHSLEFPKDNSAGLSDILIKCRSLGSVNSSIRYCQYQELISISYYSYQTEIVISPGCTSFLQANIFLANQWNGIPILLELVRSELVPRGTLALMVQ